MVEKMAADIVSQMAEQRLIKDEKQEYYVYALITIVEKFLTVGTIVACSILMDTIVPTTLFLIFFFSLRKRTGGYHADAFWQCYLLTVMTYFGVVYVHTILIRHPQFMYGMLILSVCAIGLIGTVNHPNMHMNRHELTESKKAARITVLMESCVIYFAALMNINIVLISYMSIAVILCAGMLIAARILKQEVREDEENQ